MDTRNNITDHLQLTLTISRDEYIDIMRTACGTPEQQQASLDRAKHDWEILGGHNIKIVPELMKPAGYDFGVDGFHLKMIAAGYARYILNHRHKRTH